MECEVTIRSFSISRIFPLGGDQIGRQNPEKKLGLMKGTSVSNLHQFGVSILVSLLGQRLDFKLFEIYLVGKIKFKFLFQGPLAKRVSFLVVYLQ